MSITLDSAGPAPISSDLEHRISSLRSQSLGFSRDGIQV